MSNIINSELEYTDLKNKKKLGNIRDKLSKYNNEIEDIKLESANQTPAIPLKIYSQTLGFQLNEIGEKGEPEFIPIVTYRKDIQSLFFIELGGGFLSVNDHSKFTLNIDLFKTFLKINNINFFKNTAITNRIEYE